MNIFKEYVKGDIENRKENYNSTIITIFLAVLILSSFTIGIFSYYKSYREVIANSTGGYHFRIVNSISNKDANDIIKNRNIKKVGFFNQKEIDKGFGSKDKTRVFKMDYNALSTLESWIKEGHLPEIDQIMISNQMGKEIDKNVKDHINIDGEEYEISGIYYDSTYEFEEFYNIFLNIDQKILLEEEKELSPFIWYKNIFKSYDLSENLMENLETDDITYNYNKLYLDRSFVFDPEDDLFTDHTFQIIIIFLFIILIILFYAIITNLFLVQESKSIIEYSKLKALGASNKDIDRIIRLKAFYISQIPIFLGILSSIGLVWTLFFILNKVQEYFSTGEDIFSFNMDLNLNIDFKLIIFLYLISLIIIYISTRKPIKILKNNSISNGLKGNIESKEYRKYDLINTGNIEKDLSKQFYKNNKRSFRFTNITLQIGFLLMVFIMAVISYYSMEEKYNRINKYDIYEVQGQYATLNPLNDQLLEDIRSLEMEELVNFRRESVYLDLDEEIVVDEYLESGSLEKLEKELSSLKDIRIELIGIEDKKFNELVLKKGLNPSDYKGNKVILLNTMGDDFNIPISKIKDKKFLKDDIEEIGLSEYGNILEDKGYEFNLDIKDKIYEPLFDNNIKKDRLHIYMSKSQYLDLFDKFLKIADLDQFEYIFVKTEKIQETQEYIDRVSLDYFKENDFGISSKIDEEKTLRKSIIIGNILAVFFSFFFIIVGFSNCYFSFNNLFLKRKDDFLLYKAIGIDNDLLEGILKREKSKILFNFTIWMPIILLIVAYIISISSKIFNIKDILLNINYLFILIYIMIIYISISKMYDKYKRDIMKVSK